VFEPIAGSEPGEGGETLASRGADPSSIGSQSGTPEVGRVESDAGGGS